MSATRATEQMSATQAHGANVTTSDPPEQQPAPQGHPEPPPGYPAARPPYVPVRDFHREQRTWAMWCHLSALAAFVLPLGSVLGPLVVWLTKRDEFPLVNEEGKRVLNFQISMALYFVGLIIFTFVGALFIVGLIGIPIIIGLGIFWLVVVIMAAVRTSEGKRFDYPLAIPFLK